MMLKDIKSVKKVPVTITIAGSDSGGGAGIQADLKTFAALGVHGTTAITCITAQNTYSVTAVECVKPEIVKEQIKQVSEDMGIDSGKTGMLYTEEIIKVVSEEISKRGFPLVVDPVMVAKSGAPLLKPEAENALKNLLLPLATVITPNKFEAERLIGREIKDIEDAKRAAEEICTMGPKAVVVKGGHLNNPKESVDVLYYKGEHTVFRAPRLDSKTTHGTGCSFSAAIAAFIARGEDIPSAVKHAKDFITHAIKFGLRIGKGVGPVNPLATLYREASKYSVLKSVNEAKRILESSPHIGSLAPEVGINIAMALPYAESVKDVAAIPGRLMRVFDNVRSSSYPEFGASSHLARYLLEIMKYDPSKRAAINIRFSEDILALLGEENLRISYYDRGEEPEEVKRIEGMTIPWGVKQAIARVGGIPDVIYHRGDVGKEPMIIVFGEDATKLAEKIVGLSLKFINKLRAEPNYSKT
ncbi:MAG: bifunctional hydroxymethylpyrimidine kinase/phosphomethylpyrimidine kinase [Candidatus Bathyarchaeota archaeon]|nr:bifunctional hydroxymethylpyrimidine kinase/phosphomethylpyrimidine kinase [Candidatus Bathyarchaeota archaeon]